MSDDPTPSEPIEELPPPATARDALARAKGMPGAEIEGGDDPDIERTLARERPYVRLLVIMIVAIALAGFVLGALAVAVGGLVGR
jgi:hypothetical protein